MLMVMFMALGGWTFGRVVCGFSVWVGFDWVVTDTMLCIKSGAGGDAMSLQVSVE